MIILVIGALLIVIAVLIVYNIHIQKKIDTYNNINQQISNLSVLQEFMKVAGEEDSVDAKLNKINEIVIEQYDIKYSTIVVFDGAEYVIKATNVSEKHWDTLRNLQDEDILSEFYNDWLKFDAPLVDSMRGSIDETITRKMNKALDER